MFIKAATLNFLPVGVGVGSAVGGTVVIARGGMKFAGFSSKGSEEIKPMPAIVGDEFQQVISPQNPSENLLPTLLENELVTDDKLSNGSDKSDSGSQTQLKVGGADVLDGDASKKGKQDASLSKNQKSSIAQDAGSLEKPGTEGSGDGSSSGSLAENGKPAIIPAQGGVEAGVASEKEECVVTANNPCCDDDKNKDSAACVAKNAEKVGQVTGGEPAGKEGKEKDVCVTGGASEESRSLDDACPPKTAIETNSQPNVPQTGQGLTAGAHGGGSGTQIGSRSTGGASSTSGAQQTSTGQASVKAIADGIEGIFNTIKGLFV